jgi:hypothetical protein
MTAPSATAILEAALRERALLPEGATHLPPPEPGRPWFVKLLLGFSGWLAGLFGFLFLGFAFKPEGTFAFTVLGVLVLAGAYALYRLTESPFTEQLALAASIAGHVALAAAFGEATHSAGATAFAVAVLQVGWVLVAPNRMARLLSTFFGAVAWALAVRFAWWGDHLDPSRHHDIELAPALVAWFVVWTPVAAAAMALLRAERRWVAAGLSRLGRPVLAGLLVALCWGTLASEPLQGLEFWEPEGPLRINGLALWPLLGAAVSLLALAISHALRSRPLMGAAIAAALLHVLHFYLLLGVSLLAKAAVMAALGALMLAGAILLGRRGRTA